MARTNNTQTKGAESVKEPQFKEVALVFIAKPDSLKNGAEGVTYQIDGNSVTIPYNAPKYVPIRLAEMMKISGDIAAYSVVKLQA